MAISLPKDILSMSELLKRFIRLVSSHNGFVYGGFLRRTNILTSGGEIVLDTVYRSDSTRCDINVWFDRRSNFESMMSEMWKHFNFFRLHGFKDSPFRPELKVAFHGNSSSLDDDVYEVSVLISPHDPTRTPEADVERVSLKILESGSKLPIYSGSGAEILKSISEKKALLTHECVESMVISAGKRSQMSVRYSGWELYAISHDEKILIKSRSEPISSDFYLKLIPKVDDPEEKEKILAIALLRGIIDD